MNPTFLRLVAALAYCDAPEPGIDEHVRWTAVLQSIYRLRDMQAHTFLTRISNAASPNEAPAALLLRSHQMAKPYLPELLREYRAESESGKLRPTTANSYGARQKAILS